MASSFSRSAADSPIPRDATYASTKAFSTFSDSFRPELRRAYRRSACQATPTQFPVTHQIPGIRSTRVRRTGSNPVLCGLRPACCEGVVRYVRAATSCSRPGVPSKAISSSHQYSGTASLHRYISSAYEKLSGSRLRRTPHHNVSQYPPHPRGKPAPIPRHSHLTGQGLAEGLSGKPSSLAPTSVSASTRQSNWPTPGPSHDERHRARRLAVQRLKAIGTTRYEADRLDVTDQEAFLLRAEEVNGMRRESTSPTAAPAFRLLGDLEVGRAEELDKMIDIDFSGMVDGRERCLRT